MSKRLKTGNYLASDLARWDITTIKVEATRLLKRRAGLAVRQDINNLLDAIGDLEGELIFGPSINAAVTSIYGSDPLAPSFEKLANGGLRVGLRWVAILNHSSLSNGGRSGPSTPVWEIMRSKAKRFPKWPRCRIIKSAMATHELKTGKKPAHDYDYYDKNYEKVVIRRLPHTKP